MTLISTLNLENAKKQIKKAKKPVILKAQDDIFDRKALEFGKFNTLLSPETGLKKDKPKYLDSGLNSIMAKIAAKNNISIGINLSEISSLEKKEKAQRLARIKQNIQICRKAKAKIQALNCKNKKSAYSLLISLGASTNQAKEAVKETISF